MSAIADRTERLSLGTICVVTRWRPRQDSNPRLMLRRKRREWSHLEGVFRHESGRKTARNYRLIVELQSIKSAELGPSLFADIGHSGPWDQDLS